MASTNPIYNVNASNSVRKFRPGSSLPIISTGLDSIRTYQFEVKFDIPPTINVGGNLDTITLAAKQVTSPSIATEEIAVYRVNDTVYYPGRAATEEITITFDNLYISPVAQKLMAWFKQASYNPITGTQSEAGRGTFKAKKLEIIQFDNKRNPMSKVQLYGVFPKKYSLAEFNYSTNEFHTIEVVFRYDFMDNISSSLVASQIIQSLGLPGL